MKENVIVGHKIPAGTGLFNNKDVIIGSQLEMNRIESLKNETSSEEIESVDVELTEAQLILRKKINI